MIQPLVLPDHEAVSQHAADWLVERLRAKPSSLLCLATGSTPMRTYALLAERVARDPRLIAQCRVLNLDEWGGLGPDDPPSCGRQLNAALIEPLGLSDRYIAFDGKAPDPAAECARIADWLAEHGPIDTCVLGLGMNGHLGFNEPAESLQPHAHVAALSEASLAHAMIQGASRCPTGGLTLGMADLLHAEEILLLVTGAAKLGPLARVLSGRIATDFPASLLQLHPRTTVLCDTAARGGSADAGA